MVMVKQNTSKGGFLHLGFLRSQKMLEDTTTVQNRLVNSNLAMDTTDKPQLVEHIHKSLTLTV